MPKPMLPSKRSRARSPKRPSPSDVQARPVHKSSSRWRLPVSARQHRGVKRRHLALAGAVVVAVLVGHQLTKGPGVRPAVDPGAVESPAIPADAFSARVERVVDGDTFLATTADGGSVRVRVIGIDTPETVKPGVPVRCYGPAASAFTKHLLAPGT